MEENYQQNQDANMNEDGDGDQGEENHFFEGNTYVVSNDFNFLRKLRRPRDRYKIKLN
jgi:hypothetical protein